MEYTTKSAKETFELGRKIGASLKTRQSARQSGEILALSGDLGSGKTTFVQGLARGLGVKARIISPTFILMRTYGHFYHVDLYRLEGNIEEELINIGLTDFWKDKKSVIAIEWAEKAAELIPDNAIWINFERVNENERKLEIKGWGGED